MVGECCCQKDWLRVPSATSPPHTASTHRSLWHCVTESPSDPVYRGPSPNANDLKPQRVDTNPSASPSPECHAQELFSLVLRRLHSKPPPSAISTHHVKRNQMISTTVAAHPATVTALRRRYPLRPRQPLCAPIFTAATRQCMATAKPSVTNALANLSVESAPAALPKLSFPILVRKLGLALLGCGLRFLLCFV